jgi:hypothetical protein
MSNEFPTIMLGSGDNSRSLASWGSAGSASTMMASFVMALRQTAGHFTIIVVGVASKSRFRKIKPPPNQLLRSLEFDTVDRVTSNFYDF